MQVFMRPCSSYSQRVTAFIGVGHAQQLPIFVPSILPEMAFGVGVAGGLQVGIPMPMLAAPRLIDYATALLGQVIFKLVAFTIIGPVANHAGAAASALPLVVAMQTLRRAVFRHQALDIGELANALPAAINHFGQFPHSAITILHQHFGRFCREAFGPA